MKSLSFLPLRLFTLAGLASLSFCFYGKGSPSSDLDLDERPEAQLSGGLELPVWGVAESREGFDVRIWPEGVLTWLEQENLRDLIADPEVTEEEKKSLREILEQQLAYHHS